MLLLLVLLVLVLLLVLLLVVPGRWARAAAVGAVGCELVRATALPAGSELPFLDTAAEAAAIVLLCCTANSRRMMEHRSTASTLSTLLFSSAVCMAGSCVRWLKMRAHVTHSATAAESPKTLRSSEVGFAGCAVSLA